MIGRGEVIQQFVVDRLNEMIGLFTRWTAVVEQSVFNSETAFDDRRPGTLKPNIKHFNQFFLKVLPVSTRGRPF